MPTPESIDVDANGRAAPSRAEHDASGRRVAHGIGEEVAEHALEQHRVGHDGHARRHDAKRESRRLRLRREVGGESGEKRLQGDCCRRGPQRSGFELRQIEKLREQMLERLHRRADARDQRRDAGVAHSCRERGGEKPHRVQRLAQIVARSGEKLALGEARGLGGGARRERRLGLRLELADQVHVFVAHRERLGQHVVDLASERQNENEHDAQHAGGEEMHLIALDRHARDQRHENGQHEAIERRLVHGGAGQAAQDHAELADDEQRLVGRQRGKHRDRGESP